MAGLISGFGYDIFISYRQKENKGNRWVSEFVDALNTVETPVTMTIFGRKNLTTKNKS